MIPVVYRIPDWIPLLGGQAVTSFGVALLVACLAGGALFVRRLRRSSPDAGWDLVVLALVAGVIGAKALHLLVHTALGLPAGFGRGGLDWFGGLAAGAAAVLWQARRQGIDPGHVAGAAAAPLALGYAIGRIGSFLVGADYGMPTDLPTGLTFPRGTPTTTPLNLRAVFGVVAPPETLAGDFVRVHPTQLYEAVLSLGIFAVLMRGRPGGALPGGDAASRPGWRRFGLFLILSGAARALVEPLRLKQDGLFGPVTVDLIFALGVIAAGVALRYRNPTNVTREVA